LKAFLKKAEMLVYSVVIEDPLDLLPILT